ncbi:hypothetical protein AVEN_19428-1 [Araneus ventricosus]|uniref:Uncharacterized protein n=1 Tax=Araneus ventricosus TaxID=182803 RepID=A0A4Y2C842_ARAVE|nr:hypothetical protein AVEN_19428-1 [Araneus ventricosus]
MNFFEADNKSSVWGRVRGKLRLDWRNQGREGRVLRRNPLCGGGRSVAEMASGSLSRRSPKIGDVILLLTSGRLTLLDLCPFYPEEEKDLIVKAKHTRAGSGCGMGRCFVCWRSIGNRSRGSQLRNIRECLAYLKH